MKNWFFREPELLRMLYDSIKAFTFLEENQLTVGQLHPLLFTLYEDNIEPLKRVSFFRNSSTAACKKNQAKFRNVDFYQPPEVFEQYFIQSDSQEFYKHEVFSVGLMLLEAALLKSVQTVFNVLNGKFSQKNLTDFLEIVFKLYGDNSLFCAVIEKMVELDNNQRPSFLELYQALPQWNEVRALFDEQLRLKNQKAMMLLSVDFKSKFKNCGFEIFQPGLQKLPLGKLSVKEELQSSARKDLYLNRMNQSNEEFKEKIRNYSLSKLSKQTQPLQPNGTLKLGVQKSRTDLNNVKEKLNEDYYAMSREKNPRTSKQNQYSISNEKKIDLFQKNFISPRTLITNIRNDRIEAKQTEQPFVPQYSFTEPNNFPKQILSQVYKEPQVKFVPPKKEESNLQNHEKTTA